MPNPGKKTKDKIAYDFKEMLMIWGFQLRVARCLSSPPERLTNMQN